VFWRVSWERLRSGASFVFLLALPPFPRANPLPFTYSSDELRQQNSTLAQHLETASAQATQLQSRHAAITDGTSAEGASADADTIEAITASHNSSVEQLREVIRYLRREKDIIDLQFDFSKQEAARLKQQLEFTSRNLEEARQTVQEVRRFFLPSLSPSFADSSVIEQERQKAGDSLTSAASHTELLESIHTAKLLRESNQTLRDENEANLRKVSSLNSQVRTLQAEISPLREQVRTLEADVESKKHNIKLLEEDNERWKTRNQTILAKYERIDPEELQVLKSEVEKVQAQLAAVEQEKEDLGRQLEEKTNLVRPLLSCVSLSPRVDLDRLCTGRVDAHQLAERSRALQSSPNSSPNDSRRAQRPSEVG
jgi:nucleoprotein TPR